MIPHVQPGDPIRHSATDRNAMADAANWYTGQRQSTGFDPLRGLDGRVIVDVINGTGEALQRWDAVYITTPAILPSADVEEFYERPTFHIEQPAEFKPSARVAILIEPIADGEAGRAILSGMLNCQIYVHHANHTHADVDWTGSRRTLETKYGGPAHILWKESGTGLLHASLLLSHREGDRFVELGEGETLDARDGDTMPGMVMPILYAEGIVDGSDLTLQGGDGYYAGGDEMHVYNYAPGAITGPKRLAVAVTDHGVPYVSLDPCKDES